MDLCSGQKYLSVYNMMVATEQSIMMIVILVSYQTPFDLNYSFYYYASITFIAVQCPKDYQKEKIDYYWLLYDDGRSATVTNDKLPMISCNAT